MTVLDMVTERAIMIFLGDNDHVSPDLCHYLSVEDKYPSVLLLNKLPVKRAGMTRVIIVSDTHERHNKLRNFPDGDIFIHCGDILMTSRFSSVESGSRKLYWFNEWMKSIPCKHKVIIAGNHDCVIEKIGKRAVQTILSDAIYLENDLVVLNKLKIWGTPLSAGRSSNKAFQSEEFKKETMLQVPLTDIDILLTHGHCPELEQKVSHHVHLWGHAHNSYGIRRPPMTLKGKSVVSLSICAPIMDKYFRPSHLPVVLDLSAADK